MRCGQQLHFGPTIRRTDILYHGCNAVLYKMTCMYHMWQSPDRGDVDFDYQNDLLCVNTAQSLASHCTMSRLVASQLV